MRIQARASGVGSRGESTGDWSDVAQRWAAVTTLSGDELERARQRMPEARLQVKIRYLGELTTRHRLLFGSRVLQIGHIDDVDQLHIEQILTCSEVP